ncbi:MAG: primosomal protein DnaI [bacterium]
MDKMEVSKIKDIQKKIDKELEISLKNEDFKKLVARLGVEKEEIRKNITKINDTVEELKLCSDCKGIFSCKNNLIGHIYFPQNIDGKVRFAYTPCKYQKKFIKDREINEKSRNVLENSRMKDIDLKDKNRVKVIKFLKQFYDDFDYNKNIKGLYLHGSFGAGKSFLISCLFNELKEKKNVEGVIIYFPELLRSLRDDFSLLDSKVNYLKSVPLLMIDDIGAEKVTDWGRDEILGAILQYRMNEGLSTFFTSNFNIKELEAHLSMTRNNEDNVKARRIIERIKQLTEDVELISINRRN